MSDEPEKGKEKQAFSKARIVVAVLFVIGYAVTIRVIETFRSSIEASVATMQVEDSIVTYSLAQKFITDNVMTYTATLILVVGLIALLYAPLRKLLKGE